ncbi:DUF2076 domain-containing protein [Bosea thiooxidans]
MTPQERDVIAGIFDRLRQAANQPRDPEAEAFIAERLREQPYAPYAMAQAVYVQEQALANLNQQVESLQAQLKEAQAHAGAAPEPQQQSGGFLSGIFGGGGAQPRGSVPSVPPRQDAPPASSAWNTQPQGRPGQPQPQPMQETAQPGPWSNQPRGGGFLQGALTTAAGVAGGMMLGNILTNAFGGHGAASSTPSQLAGNTSGQSQSDTGASSQQAAYDQGASDQAAQDRAEPDRDGPNYDNANYEDDDPGFDDGGGDDGDSWV